MFYLAVCCSCFFFIFTAGFYFCEIFTNGHKTSLRHLWIVLKWSYVDKTYTCCFRNLYIWSKRSHNVKFPTSLLQKSKAFTTCLRRPFYDQVSTLQQQRRVLEVVFLYPCKEYGLWILFGSLIRNSGDIAVFWWQIRQGWDLITFPAAGIKKRGYNIYMLRWYLKTIFNCFLKKL